MQDYLLYYLDAVVIVLSDSEPNATCVMSNYLNTINISGDVAEKLRKYLNPSDYNVLHYRSNMFSTTTYIKKSIFRDPRYSLDFLKYADIFYCDKPMCNIGLVNYNRKDILNFILEYVDKLRDHALDNLSEILNIINSTDTATLEDISLIKSCIEKNDFTELELLVEVI